jgi:hypothetical protein
VPSSVGQHELGVRGGIFVKSVRCFIFADHAAPVWNVLALLTNGTYMKIKEPSVAMFCRVCIMDKNII